MLFTSTTFFFIFLPVVFCGFYVLGSRVPQLAAGWLFVASMVFYGYWMPQFIILLLGSICWNFWIGGNIGRLNPGIARVEDRRRAKAWLVVGISANLAALGYFKYAEFCLDNLNILLGQEWTLGPIILPIGISFFTFTQIAFLADAYLKGTKEYGATHYGLFVTYFPHLIAGPVLHHAQMMPQFREDSTYRLNSGNIASGFAIFAVGLFKKIVLADGISPYADAVFAGAASGTQPDFVEAWVGALAYTFQLYFDFSGYSDMAIGLSWLFNVRLPYNFNSPYKALSIADFWRRWHMTLSAFLRDYLYIPLGGNRMGSARRVVNLWITMVLGGLWHGANWTFVFWGALHGFYLSVNHAFQSLSLPWLERVRSTAFFRFIAWSLTFLSVVVAWVFFRASDFSSALRVLSGLLSPLNTSAGVSDHVLLFNQGLDLGRGIFWLGVLGAIATLLPSSNDLGEWLLARCRNSPKLSPFVLGCALVGTGFLVVVNGARDSVSAFIYFNF